MTHDDDDLVGYKRPPKHTRFRPGHSGNPTGRKKNSRNFKTDLVAELHEKIPIRENGRDMRTTKQRAFVKALVAAAIKGDMRATTALVSFCTRSLGSEDEEDVNASPAAEDVEIIEAFVKRERKRQRFKSVQEKSTTRKKKG
jgi:uncharacterized protein DUF5681